MTENKLVSSKSIIAKIIADNDMNENDIRISDMREWIGEAMEKIGAIQQLEHKVAVIPIICHQAKLPCDLYKIDQVAYSFSNGGGWLPMRKITGSFNIPQDPKICGDNCSCSKDSNCMIIPDSGLIPLVKNLYNLTDDRQALDILNADQNVRQTLSALVNQYTVPTVNGRYVGIEDNWYDNNLQYMTKPGYVMTLNKSGFIKVSYYAIITDEDALPMIPDNISYSEALYWYVTMKLEFPNYKNGKLPRHVYYDIKNSWNFYRKQAYAEAMLPSGTDELHTIQNTWLRLYPEIDDHDTFFNSTGSQQKIYNQTN